MVFTPANTNTVGTYDVAAQGAAGKRARVVLQVLLVVPQRTSKQKQERFRLSLLRLCVRPSDRIEQQCVCLLRIQKQIVLRAAFKTSDIWARGSDIEALTAGLALSVGSPPPSRIPNKGDSSSPRLLQGLGCGHTECPGAWGRHRTNPVTETQGSGPKIHSSSWPCGSAGRVSHATLTFLRFCP